MIFRHFRNLAKDEANRDGEKTLYPLVPDLRKSTARIAQAHEILRLALKDHLDLVELDLESYLKQMMKEGKVYTDEYGQVITSYKEVFRIIQVKVGELKLENYAEGQLDKDKLDLCSVARYLSHQPTVTNRETLMKRIRDALGYRCHPCTPYTAKENDVTKVLNFENIPVDNIMTPEAILSLCNGSSPFLVRYS